MAIQAYSTKTKKLAGTDFREVHKGAFAIYQAIKRKSKRTPYVRSAYFNKDKIFLTLFWQHLWEKDKWQGRTRRLRYFSAAIELIQNCRLAPKSMQNPNRQAEVFHRFTGIDMGGNIFYVQIKENKRSGRKDLISIFPAK